MRKFNTTALSLLALSFCFAVVYQVKDFGRSTSDGRTGNSSELPPTVRTSNLTHRLSGGEPAKPTGTSIGNQIELSRRFYVQQQGDIAIRFDLSNSILENDGWYQGFRGTVDPFHNHDTFGGLYCGGWYPEYRRLPWSAPVPFVTGGTDMIVPQIMSRERSHAPSPTVRIVGAGQEQNDVAASDRRDVVSADPPSVQVNQLTQLRFVNNGKADRAVVRGDRTDSTPMPVNIAASAKSNSVVPLAAQTR